MFLSSLHQLLVLLFFPFSTCPKVKMDYLQVLSMVGTMMDGCASCAHVTGVGK